MAVRDWGAHLLHHLREDAGAGPHVDGGGVVCAPQQHLGGAVPQRHDLRAPVDPCQPRASCAASAQVPRRWRAMRAREAEDWQVRTRVQLANEDTQLDPVQTSMNC